MKLCLLVFLCMVVDALAFPGIGNLKAEWGRFKALHKKTYRSVSEDLFRLKIFLKNNIAVIAHNMKYKLGRVSFKAELNKFGDLMDQEYKKMAGGLKRSIVSKFYPKGAYVKSFLPIPPSVDLRTQNLVVPPRSQGNCGIGWAFSATGAIEGQLAKKTGKLIPVSQQHLLDCNEDNEGCNGGTANIAFWFIQRNGGAVSDASYPYTSNKSHCKFNPGNVVANVKAIKEIREGNDVDLQDAIAQVGPISVSIDASSQMLSFYKSGIFAPSSADCRSENINHGVLAVGYGQENGREYWLIKNSWGPDWGEGGYIKILKDGQNLCGVSTMASYPVL